MLDHKGTFSCRVGRLEAALVLHTDIKVGAWLAKHIHPRGAALALFEELSEFVNGQFCRADDASQRAAVQFAVQRNRQGVSVLGDQANMTPALPEHVIADAFQSLDADLPGNDGEWRH